MSKKDEKTAEVLEQEQPKVEEQPKSAELPQNGVIYLKGKSREEISKQYTELKASYADATLIAGCIGQDGTTFTLQVNIKSKQE